MRITRSVLLLLILLLAIPVFAQTGGTDPIAPTATPAGVDVDQVSPDDDRGVAGAISLGETVTGELTFELPALTYTLNVPSATPLRIALNSDDFDAYLILEDADGDEVARNDDGAAGTNALIDLSQQLEAGEYVIVVSSYGHVRRSAAQAGVFELSVQAPQILPPAPTQAPQVSVDAGAIAVGETVTGELTEVAPALNYTLTIAEATTVTIALDSDEIDPYLVVEDASGVEVGRDDDAGGNFNSLLTLDLLPAGDYTIIASSYGWIIGSSPREGGFELRVQSGQVLPPAPTEPPAPPPVPTVVAPSGAGLIAIGETVTGELTAAAPEQRYTLTIAEPTSVTIALDSDDFDAYLVAEDANGAEIVRNDDGGANLNSLLTLSLLPAGDYTIIASSFGWIIGGNARTGAFTLSVNGADTVTPPDTMGGLIEYTQSVEGQLTSNIREVPYTFSGQEGDSIVITMNGSFDTYLRLQDASGNEIAYNDDFGGTLNSQIGPFVLPYSGSYTIIARAFSSGEGTYTVSLNRVDVEAISYDDELTVTFAPGETVKFLTLAASTGDIVTIIVDSDQAFDTTLALLSPEGYSITSDSDSGRGFDPEIFEQYLASGGDYLISLTAVSATGGSVDVSVTRSLPPTLDDGAVTLAFSESAQDRVVTFNAEAGVTYRLTLRPLDGSEASPSVSMNLNESFYRSLNLGSSAGGSIDVSFPQSGTVLVQVSDYSYTSARYEITLEVVN